MYEAHAEIMSGPSWDVSAQILWSSQYHTVNVQDLKPTLAGAEKAASQERRTGPDD